MSNQILYYILIFIIGLSIGSFLNVVIFRIDNIKTILYERSHCPRCKKILSWKDLIPFVSFMLLGGKCRYCNEPISRQYSAVELSTAILYAILFCLFGLSWGLVFYLIIFSILIVVFVYDLKHELILEEFVWVALALTLLGSWYFSGLGIPNILLGGLICGGIPTILVFVSKEKWMGMGDIKLGFLLGALVGYPQAVFLIFASFVLGSIVGMILMSTKKKGIKDSVPFAPFLILAGLVTLIWGNNFVNWYLGYLYI